MGTQGKSGGYYQVKYSYRYGNKLLHGCGKVKGFDVGRNYYSQVEKRPADENRTVGLILDGTISNFGMRFSTFFKAT
jgi:hypothetical protein